MKNKVLLVLVTLNMLSCQSESDDQTKKEELRIVLSDYYDALGKKDLQKMNSLTTGNFVVYDEGVIYTNESAVKAVEGMGDFTVTFKFDSMNAHIDKTNASAYHIREATFTIHDTIYPPMRFLESATFKKEGDKWKLRFLHSSMRK
ncbi:MAG: DUF4440 domain-containing protein [Bacteroidota bacterium]